MAEDIAAIGNFLILSQSPERGYPSVMDISNPHQEITIRDLYPDLNDEQLKEAEENLERYLELALRMYDRIRLDPEAYARFKALTDSARDRYDGDGQRSNINRRT